METPKYHISKLCLVRPDPRKAANDYEMEVSIASDGVLNPVVVTPLDVDLFDVIDGERRVGIARRLAERGSLDSAKALVPCLVLNVRTAQERARLRLLFNLSSGLPDAEIRHLKEEATSLFPIGDVPIEESGKTIPQIEDLLQALGSRKSAIRNCARTIQILETARDYIRCGATLAAALNRLRYAGEPEQ